MNAIKFEKATKRQSRLRMALIGPSGSGKTYTALSLATVLADGGRVAVADTERGSASKYSDIFDFDVMELESFSPQTYVQVIQAAEEAGYKVLVIDSLSHAWMGKDGALEMVDREAAKNDRGNSFAAWRKVTPHHNNLVDAMLRCDMHLLVTMRTKTEYVQEKDEKGKTVIRKVGLQPVQRDGLEYEFDVVGDMNQDNQLIVGKTRCSALRGAVIDLPGKKLAQTLAAWLGTGEAARKTTAKGIGEEGGETIQTGATTTPQPETNGHANGHTNGQATPTSSSAPLSPMRAALTREIVEWSGVKGAHDVAAAFRSAFKAIGISTEKGYKATDDEVKKALTWVRSHRDEGVPWATAVTSAVKSEPVIEPDATQIPPEEAEEKAEEKAEHHAAPPVKTAAHYPDHAKKSPVHVCYWLDKLEVRAATWLKDHPDVASDHTPKQLVQLMVEALGLPTPPIPEGTAVGQYRTLAIREEIDFGAFAMKF